MPRKQQDDPHAQLRMIYALSLFYAKNAAKAAIRAEGKRVTDYRRRTSPEWPARSLRRTHPSL